MQTEYIKKVTQSLISLPTLPTVASQLLDLAGDESVDKEELEAIISSDPALAAKLLKMTNGGRESVTGIHRAIGNLGLEQTCDIALEASMSGAFVFNNTNIDLQKFWDHCSAVGVVARLAAQEYEPSLAADAFTAGLLHDVGKIVLIQYFGKEFENAVEASRSQNRELYLIEKETLGTSHGQIGAWLAEQWRLPRSIQEVMQYHHDLSRAEINRPLVALVSFADVLCRILKAGNGGNSAAPTFTDDLAAELGKWKIKLSMESLQPFMLFCIDELDKRRLTHYAG